MNTEILSALFGGVALGLVVAQLVNYKDRKEQKRRIKYLQNNILKLEIKLRHARLDKTALELYLRKINPDKFEKGGN